ncbi:MAG: hypothetical protein A2X67_07480 [Ignavibacteria bacterium GWA2_55_11]|nr:MAG: hypothetical protein A2X67_07480 [Ignavibacteria bacterium GWA2_55_11]OGU43629.1 MAG: hypothetical protein A2X68_06345 [Ignavibacteria bacterium GWC2_56_12]OGU66237.1 MAG: hypothetical protein A3C56_08215 [Ignavibacteria bacterium RIFCSPHIGHO2_02_FULL_56_12]
MPFKESEPMKRSLMLSATLLFIFFSPLLDAQKRYYKGNTHTHCYPWSGDIRDSSYTAEAVVSQYSARRYDFIVFTNHGTWFDASGLSTPEMTVISGSEVGISGKGRWGHFSAVGLDAKLSGAGLTHQQLIDSIVAHGAIAFVNHPRFSMIPLTAVHVLDSMTSNLRHMEVWNGATAKEPPPNDISVWDSVLSTGRLMYGISCDDSHRSGHQGKAWIMVYASSNRQSDLLAAIRNGDFYATNGIVMDSISTSAQQVFVKSSNGDRIRFIGDGGKDLLSLEGGEGSYAIKGNEVYVRAEVSNASGQRAWIQPVIVERSGK